MEDEQELAVGWCLFCGGRLVWLFDWGWHTHCDRCRLSIKEIRVLFYLAYIVTLFLQAIPQKEEHEELITSIA